MNFFWRVFLFFVSLGFIAAIAGVILTAAIIYKYGQSLPDFVQLKDYRPPVVTRVYATDGRFLAEFAQEKRIFVPVDEIPPLVKNAFIAAEDQNFYQHKGVDVFAIGRAVITNVKNRAEGRRPVGASTITQQVAKNFLLGNELSYERKIREAILAFRIEQVLSKDRLLELYLNEIFLGARSYGVAAAGLHYFNKPLQDLTVAEVAYLAALPKAPNNYNPIRNREAAIARRNWVVDRMVAENFITPAQAELAKASALETTLTDDDDVVNAPYYAEEVRRELLARYGADGLYRGGLSARTSLDPALQNVAEKVLQDGLVTYDRRHGWRGPVARLGVSNAWSQMLTDFARPEGMLDRWRLAMVLGAKGARIDIGFSDQSKGYLNELDSTWSSSDPLKVGDIILVEKDKPDDATNFVYNLRQIPMVQGALVALDPNTGRVLAMQGGWKFDKSEFNRVTQAKRQPGSAFKPFIYLAALDKGYTPSSIIVDAPVTFTDSAGNVWNPENYSGEFYGPTPLRVGVEKSRNLMTIRLSQNIGIESVADYAAKFGINPKMEKHLANALGSTETTLLQLTTAYGMIVNGGKKISPSFIDRVQDRYGKTVGNTDTRTCDGCGPLVRWENQTTPTIADMREQIGDPRTCYQMVSILEGVVQRGTARSLIELDRPLAGKTGTTNDSKDAWFIGFTPDLVVGVFVGFDNPKSLGEKETGGSVAVPIFKNFIRDALKDVPPTPFRIPPGVRMVQVNAQSGRPTTPSDPNAIWEAFLAGTEPNNTAASEDIYGPARPESTPSFDPNLDPNAAYSPSQNLQPQPQSQPPIENPPPSETGTGGLY